MVNSSLAPKLKLPGISKDTETLDISLPEMNQVIGLLAVLVMAMSSGFASTFFEKCLKTPSESSDKQLMDLKSNDDSLLPRHTPSTVTSSPTHSKAETPLSVSSTEPLLRTLSTQSTITHEKSGPVQVGLWIRNVQLSSFALLMGVLMFYLETNKQAFRTVAAGLGSSWSRSDPLFGSSTILLQETNTTRDILGSVARGVWNEMRPAKQLADDFFAGFRAMAWFIVGLQILGGLIAALVIKVRSFLSCSIL